MNIHSELSAIQASARNLWCRASKFLRRLGASVVALFGAFSNPAFAAPTPIREGSQAAVALVALAGLISWRRFTRRGGASRVEAQEADMLATLRRLATDSNVIFWRFDPDADRFLSLSAHAAQLFGYSVESWTQAGVWRGRVLPADISHVMEVMAECRRQQSVAELEFRILRENGEEIAVRSLMAALPHETGAPGVLSGLFIDVSMHFALRTALSESERRFRSVMEQIPNISVQGYDKDRRVVFWNRASERLYGYSPEEAVGQLLEDLIIPDFIREAVKRDVQNWLSKGVAIPAGELPLRRKDGSLVPVYSSHVMTYNAAREAEMYCVDVDLTEMKRAERAARESETRFRLTFDEAPVGICVCAPDGRFVEVNPAFGRICGRTPEELKGVSVDTITHPDDQVRNMALSQDCLAGGRHGYVIEKRYIRKDGNAVWVELTVSLLRDENGEPLQFIGIVEDITERRESRERIAFLAHHDALTGLPNRSLLQDRLNMALAQATRSGHSVALLFLDLDRFKTINDSLGHVIGDRLLQAVAARLARHTRGADTVSRQGGDEFIILLSEVESAEAALAVARKIVAILDEPYEVSGHLLSCSGSIGIAMFPEHGRDGDTLMRHADMAMYNAKDGGRNTVRMFHSVMTNNAVERLKIENALRRALDRREFELHYQPQVELSSGRLIGVEALLRWNSSVLGNVPPGSFIPVAEETGLIVSIGAWVMREACRQIRAWQDAGIAVVPVAINLSALQFYRTDVVATLRDVLADSGVVPELIELELTESLLMSNAEGVLQTMRELKALGVSMSIDDFGTGYSSLSYLKRFPVDRLKVDRSFVRDVADDPDDAAIVRAIVQLGRSLKIDVIAEGVESRAQVEFLAAEGCDSVQGYYFARPLPAEKVTPIIQVGAVRPSELEGR